MSAPEPALFDVVCRLISASRGVLEETTGHASLRLAGAARDLAALAAELPDIDDERRAYYLRAAEALGGVGEIFMRERDRYPDHLDALLRDMASEVRRHHEI